MDLTTYTVTTYAGVCRASGGYLDGPWSTALFSTVGAARFDSSGNIFVADTNNYVIRRVDGSTRYVSTVAGTSGTSGTRDGPASTAMFNYPLGLAIDSSGKIYVTDAGSNSIRLISSSMVSTFAGSSRGLSGFVNGIGTYASFNFPIGIAFDSSQAFLYISDNGNNVIRKIVISTGNLHCSVKFFTHFPPANFIHILFFKEKKNFDLWKKYLYF